MDDLCRPYIIYLTAGQHEELAHCIRQTSLYIETFKYVHQDLHFLVDLIIHDEELALNTIRNCKENKEGMRQAKKMRYTSKIKNTRKTERDAFSSLDEFQRSDNNSEIRNIMVNANVETLTYHDSPLNLLEEKHVEHDSPLNLLEEKHVEQSSDNEDPKQESSKEKRVKGEKLLTGTQTDNLVQEITHVNMTNESNTEFKGFHQEENKDDHLLNLKRKRDNIAEQNTCEEGDMKGDVQIKDMKMIGKYSNYNLRPKSCMDHFKLVQLVNMAEHQNTCRCDICGMVAVSEQCLKSHKEKIHSDKTSKKKKIKLKQRKGEVAVCHICRKLFVDKYSLNNHKMKMHGDKQDMYQCDICGAVLKHLGNLVQHKKSLHGGTRSYHCDVCGSSFKLYQHLKTHRRRHDSSFVETCTICGKTVRKGHLSTHMKRHSSEKKFQCNTCNKAFHVRQDLDRHVILHSGDKPHKCQLCSYACALKGNLTKHVNKKHDGKLSLSDNKDKNITNLFTRNELI